MRFHVRITSALRAALIHLVICAALAMCAALLVFFVWYPFPYDQLSGGRHLFLLLVAVDVTCGPLLTLVLFSPEKAKHKWHIDLALIVLIQFGALIYGLHSVASARPVFLAFEGDRFRVVQANDIDKDKLKEAPPGLTSLSIMGPRLVSTRLTQPTDPYFPISVQLSLQGLPPAFRPSRWIDYSSQRARVLENLQPLNVINKKNLLKQELLDELIANTGLQENQLGYLPLVNGQVTDWVVVIDRNNATPRAYLHVDGW
jgi:hypothetical protein